MALLARATRATHNLNASDARRRKFSQQAFLNAASTHNACVRTQARAKRRLKLAARNAHNALRTASDAFGTFGTLFNTSTLHAGQTMRKQLSISWISGLKRARWAHRGARATPNAALRAHNKLPVNVGDAASCARRGALHAFNIAIAHLGAAPGRNSNCRTINSSNCVSNIFWT
jgi:hypothetical protein